MDLFSLFFDTLRYNHMTGSLKMARVPVGLIMAFQIF